MVFKKDIIIQSDCLINELYRRGVVRRFSEGREI